MQLPRNNKLNPMLLHLIRLISADRRLKREKMLRLNPCRFRGNLPPTVFTGALHAEHSEIGRTKTWIVVLHTTGKQEVRFRFPLRPCCPLVPDIVHSENCFEVIFKRKACATFSAIVNGQRKL
jgi:hypothetical protein